MANLVNKIRDKGCTQWRHVGTDKNPADIDNRGCQADKPRMVDRACSKEKEILATVTETKDDIDDVLEKKSIEKTARVTICMRSLFNKCKQKKLMTLVGPLMTSKTTKKSGDRFKERKKA